MLLLGLLLTIIGTAKPSPDQLRTFATVLEVGPWRERSIIVGDPECVLEDGTDADVEMVVEEVFDTDMKMKKTVVEAVPDTETVLPSLLGSHTEQVGVDESGDRVAVGQLHTPTWLQDTDGEKKLVNVKLQYALSYPNSVEQKEMTGMNVETSEKPAEATPPPPPPLPLTRPVTPTKPVLLLPAHPLLQLGGHGAMVPPQYGYGKPDYTLPYQTLNPAVYPTPYPAPYPVKYTTQYQGPPYVFTGGPTIMQDLSQYFPLRG